MSMSAFAHATAAAGGIGDLSLNILSSYSVSALDTSSPYNATAGMLIANNGNLSEQENGSYTSVTGWLATGSASDVQVKILKTGGTATATGMTDDQWYDCSSSQSFSIARTIIGQVDWSGTMSFRHKNTQSSLGSATVTLSAEAGNV